MNTKGSLDIRDLLKYQPNRYPFLMIDKVTELDPGKYAKGYKNVSNNEWYIPCHFPDDPNMPGALQLEALSQMLTVALLSMPELEGRSIVHGLQHSIRLKREVCQGIDWSWKRGLFHGKGEYVKGLALEK